MSTTRAYIAAQLAPSYTCVFKAACRNERSVYAQTRTRTEMRRMLDAAAILGATVTLAFLKKDGTTLRYMACRPILGADGTCKYYTVQDLELSAQEVRNVYRRVNLDTVAVAQVEYRA